MYATSLIFVSISFVSINMYLICPLLWCMRPHPAVFRHNVLWLVDIELFNVFFSESVCALHGIADSICVFKLLAASFMLLSNSLSSEAMQWIHVDRRGSASQCCLASRWECFRHFRPYFPTGCILNLCQSFFCPHMSVGWTFI